MERVDTIAPAMVTTPDTCVRYVDEVGICAWRRMKALPDFPSLEQATPWEGKELTNQTWFWKDDLHIERRLYFGTIIAPDAPAFVSLAFLPYLIAAQGDIDARTLHEKGHLSASAIRVYEHIERHGPTATSALPFLPGSRMLYMATLQQKFLLTKYDLTGRTRGTYGYRWGLCEEIFPESFAKAAKLAVPEARARVIEHLNTAAGRTGGAPITAERASRLFRWQPL